MELDALLEQLYSKIKFEIIYRLFYNKKERTEEDWVNLLKSLERVRKIIGNEAYRIAEKYNTKSRVKWLKNHKKEIEEIASTFSDPTELIIKAFYEGYRGCKFSGEEKDSALIKKERIGNPIILHFICCNECPILKYSTKLGIDNLPICKNAYERGAGVFLNVLMNLTCKKCEVAYIRDYHSLRPKKLFCYEIVIVSCKNE